MEHKHPLGVINTYRLTVILSNYPIQLSTGNELTWSRSRLWTLTLTVLLASFILSNSIVLKIIQTNEIVILNFSKLFILTKFF